MSIGKKRRNLIVWEKTNGFKAKDIAKKLGITQQTYCNIKNGKTTPSIEFAYKFSEVYPDEDVLELMKLDEE